MSAHAGTPARRKAIDAIIELVAEHGYEGTDMPEILEAAALSHAEFQAVFADKRACFLAAHEELADRLYARVRKAIGQPGWFPERARAALRTLVTTLAATPQLTGAAIVELLALGPAGQASHQASVERYAELVEDARELSQYGAELPESISLMAVGGVAALIFDEVLAGRAAELESLVPELVFALLLPFVGPEAAAQELRGSERLPGAAR